MSLIPLLLAATAPAALAAPAEEPQRADRDVEIVVNGQRIVENGDDYGAKASSTATRLPLSQRETPQSVSVITRAQIEDFRLNDVNALLATATGINVQQTETDRVYYTARGFDITNFQIDGIGLPFANGIQNGALDTATYERIEVVRGAAGLLSSTGNPSATINFIRKRPTRDLAASASFLYGSFDQKRVDADISVPLTGNGAIRARAVGAFLDTDSYLDRYRGKRSIVYGIVEADLGPSTVASVGYQRQDSRTRAGMWGGLPLTYSDGTPLDLPRRTNTGTDWVRWNILDQQIFGDITHTLANGWVVKASAQRRAIDEDERLFYIYGLPNRQTGLGIASYPGAFVGPTRNLTLDLYAAGDISLFGRAHQVVVGLNRGAERFQQSASYDDNALNLPLTLRSAFDGSFPRPNFPAFTLRSDFHSLRESAYGLLRLNPADAVKVMLGLNVTRTRREGYSYGLANDFDRTRALPFVGATVDLGSAISAYASYSSIFNPQVEIDASRRVLPPIEGNTLEAGLKGAWYDNRLNASIAVFRNRQDNTAEVAGFDTTIGQSVYRGVDATSEGIELDVGGQLAPGLQLTGGYTLMRIRGDDGQAVRTYVPRQTGRLNLTYAVASAPGLKLGAAVQYQSRIYREAGIVEGSDGTPIVTRQSGYALVDLMARYDFDQHWSLSGNVRNLTDRKYVTSLMWEQGLYGPPRTVMATLGWRF